MLSRTYSLYCPGDVAPRRDTEDSVMQRESPVKTRFKSETFFDSSAV